MEILHNFHSEKSDGADETLVRPSNWNDNHDVNGVIKFGSYGQCAFSGQVWSTLAAQILAYSKLDWLWLQCSFPYSGDMSACGDILKAANKRIILHGWFSDDPAIAGTYDNWDELYAGGGTAYALAATALIAQVDNIGLANIAYLTIQEEEPTRWTGTVAHYIAAFNAIATLVRAEFPTIKIMGSPDATLSNGEIQSLDLDALMWYSYEDADAGAGLTYSDHMDRAVTIAAAKSWNMDKIFTLLCAQNTAAESWAPDTHIENLYRTFNLCVRKGITNIGFYPLNEADATYESFLLNVYDVNEHSGAAATIADGGTISHGYIGLLTPVVILASPSVSGEMVSVTGINTWLFSVAIKKNDGTAGTTQTIYWRASDSEWHSPYLHKMAMEHLIATYG